MKELIFEKTFSVHTYETDTNWKLSTSSLFNYLQDMASSHAEVLHFGKDDLEKKNRFWVLSRILCEVREMPDLGDKIIIKTWPRGVEKLFALRDFEIYNSQGQRIGGATSCWLMLDSDTRRPLRPDDLLPLINNDISDLQSLDRLPGKLKALDEKAYKSPINKVRYSDLDINMHVNNVKYLQWTLDSYPLEFLINNTIRSVEINYLSETLPGDDIVICSEEEKGALVHSVIRKNIGKEACRLRIEWHS